MRVQSLRAATYWCHLRRGQQRLGGDGLHKGPWRHGRKVRKCRPIPVTAVLAVSLGRALGKGVHPPRATGRPVWSLTCGSGNPAVEGFRCGSIAYLPGGRALRVCYCRCFGAVTDSKGCPTRKSPSTRHTHGFEAHCRHSTKESCSGPSGHRPMSYLGLNACQSTSVTVVFLVRWCRGLCLPPPSHAARGVSVVAIATSNGLRSTACGVNHLLAEDC
jgi:hypothetical protein